MHKRIAAFLEVLAVLAATLLLFKLGCDAAYAERGYQAIGGEYCIFILPYLWFGIRPTAQCRKADQDSRLLARKDRHHES